MVTTNQQRTEMGKMKKIITIDADEITADLVLATAFELVLKSQKQHPTNSMIWETRS